MPRSVASSSWTLSSLTIAEVMKLRIGSSSWLTQLTMRIVSAVTPRAVAPPLSPSKGAKHSGAKNVCTFTRPVSVSHRSPKSTSRPRSWATLKLITPSGSGLPGKVGSPPSSGSVLAGPLVAGSLLAGSSGSLVSGSLDAGSVLGASVPGAASVATVVSSVATESSSSPPLDTTMPITTSATTAIAAMGP